MRRVAAFALCLLLATLCTSSLASASLPTPLQYMRMMRTQAAPTKIVVTSEADTFLVGSTANFTVTLPAVPTSTVVVAGVCRAGNAPSAPLAASTVTANTTFAVGQTTAQVLFSAHISTAQTQIKCTFTQTSGLPTAQAGDISGLKTVLPTLTHTIPAVVAIGASVPVSVTGGVAVSSNTVFNVTCANAVSLEREFTTLLTIDAGAVKSNEYTYTADDVVGSFACSISFVSGDLRYLNVVKAPTFAVQLPTITVTTSPNGNTISTGSKNTVTLTSSTPIIGSLQVSLVCNSTVITDEEAGFIDLDFVNGALTATATYTAPQLESVTSDVITCYTEYSGPASGGDSRFIGIVYPTISFTVQRPTITVTAGVSDPALVNSVQNVNFLLSAAVNFNTYGELKFELSCFTDSAMTTSYGTPVSVALIAGNNALKTFLFKLTAVAAAVYCKISSPASSTDKRYQFSSAALSVFAVVAPTATVRIDGLTSVTVLPSVSKTITVSVSDRPATGKTIAVNTTCTNDADAADVQAFHGVVDFFSQEAYLTFVVPNVAAAATYTCVTELDTNVAAYDDRYVFTTFNDVTITVELPTIVFSGISSAVSGMPSSVYINTKNNAQDANENVASGKVVSVDLSCVQKASTSPAAGSFATFTTSITHTFVVAGLDAQSDAFLLIFPTGWAGTARCTLTKSTITDLRFTNAPIVSPYGAPFDVTVTLPSVSLVVDGVSQGGSVVLNTATQQPQFSIRTTGTDKLPVGNRLSVSVTCVTDGGRDADRATSRTSETFTLEFDGDGSRVQSVPLPLPSPAALASKTSGQVVCTPGNSIVTDVSAGSVQPDYNGRTLPVFRFSYVFAPLTLAVTTDGARTGDVLTFTLSSSTPPVTGSTATGTVVCGTVAHASLFTATFTLTDSGSTTFNVATTYAGVYTCQATATVGTTLTDDPRFDYSVSNMAASSTLVAPTLTLTSDDGATLQIGEASNFTLTSDVAVPADLVVTVRCSRTLPNVQFTDLVFTFEAGSSFELTELLSYRAGVYTCVLVSITGSSAASFVDASFVGTSFTLEGALTVAWTGGVNGQVLYAGDSSVPLLLQAAESVQSGLVFSRSGRCRINGTQSNEFFPGSAPAVTLSFADATTVSAPALRGGALWTVPTLTTATTINQFSLVTCSFSYSGGDQRYVDAVVPLAYSVVNPRFAVVSDITSGSSVYVNTQHVLQLTVPNRGTNVTLATTVSISCPGATLSASSFVVAAGKGQAWVTLTAPAAAAASITCTFGVPAVGGDPRYIASGAPTGSFTFAVTHPSLVASVLPASILPGDEVTVTVTGTIAKTADVSVAVSCTATGGAASVSKTLTIAQANLAGSTSFTVSVAQAVYTCTFAVTSADVRFTAAPIDTLTFSVGGVAASSTGPTSSGNGAASSSASNTNNNGAGSSSAPNAGGAGSSTAPNSGTNGDDSSSGSDDGSASSSSGPSDAIGGGGGNNGQILADPSADDDLTEGAKAGIALGVIVGVAVIAGGIYIAVTGAGMKSAAGAAAAAPAAGEMSAV